MQNNDNKVIRLTEAEFHQFIDASVKQYLEEGRFSNMAKKVGKRIGKAALYGAIGAGSLYALDKGMENQEKYQNTINQQASEMHQDKAAKWLQDHDMQDTPQNREVANKAVHESKRNAMLSMIIRESIHKALNK